jgi:hypothetical protein
MGCHVAMGGHAACPRPKPLIWQVGPLHLTIKWREAITARREEEDNSLAREEWQPQGVMAVISLVHRSCLASTLSSHSDEGGSISPLCSINPDSLSTGSTSSRLLLLSPYTLAPFLTHHAKGKRQVVTRPCLV